jgi:hypothetical protein
MEQAPTVQSSLKTYTERREKMFKKKKVKRELESQARYLQAIEFHASLPYEAYAASVSVREAKRRDDVKRRTQCPECNPIFFRSY